MQAPPPIPPPLFVRFRSLPEKLETWYLKEGNCLLVCSCVSFDAYFMPCEGPLPCFLAIEKHSDVFVIMLPPGVSSPRLFRLLAMHLKF